MIEMVPVGATVVTLQLRSLRIGRMRLPSASRAQVASGPQMLRSHSGKTPRSVGEPLRLVLGLVVDELPASAAQLHRLGANRRASPSADEEVGESHDPEADAPDALGQLGDLLERVVVGVDDVLEEVGGEVHHLDAGAPSRCSAVSVTNAPRLIEPRLQTS